MADRSADAPQTAARTTLASSASSGIPRPALALGGALGLVALAAVSVGVLVPFETGAVGGLRAPAQSAVSSAAKGSEGPAHPYFAAQEIAQFQQDPKWIPLPAPAAPPDGPPIGDDEETWLP